MASSYVEGLQLAAFNNPGFHNLHHPLSPDCIHNAQPDRLLQSSSLEAEIKTAIFGNLIDQSKPKPSVVKSDIQTQGPDMANDSTPDDQIKAAIATSRFTSLQTNLTIILVHGAWQTTSSLDHLATYLRAYGHKVLTPALPSSTTRPAVRCWDSDVAAVRGCASREISRGRDVVLVMHSYGAVVGCEALKDLPFKTPGEQKKAGIIKLGFIAGWIPKQGDGLWGQDRKVRWRPGMALNEDLILIYDGANRFYNDLPLGEAETLAGKLTMHSRLALASPLTHTTHRDLPSAYLMTTLDRALPPRMQAMMAKGAGSQVTLLKAGHVPHASEEGAKEVGKWVRREVIGEALSKL